MTGAETNNSAGGGFMPLFLDAPLGRTISVATRPFGPITVDEAQRFDFPEGIPGFNYVHSFVFLQEEGTPFLWMQALEEPSLAFVVIEPESFMKNYELSIAQSELEAIGVADINDIKVLLIVTIPDNPSDMTANLQGPVLLNMKNRNGRQAISQNDKYRVRHRIVDEMNGGA